MWEVVVAAARAGRGNAVRVLLAAILVSLPAAVLEILLHTLIDRSDVPLAVAADLTTSGVNLLGVILLSGVLSQIVGESAHGRPHARLRDIVRSLSWGRLIRADITVAVLVTMGFLALVIPGLAAMTFFAVVGPVVELEHRPVWSALRRSGRLVRRHVWAVVLLVTVPALAVGAIPSVLPGASSVWRALGFLAFRGGGEALVETVLGLLLVELAYRLIEEERAPGQRIRAMPAPNDPGS